MRISNTRYQRQAVASRAPGAWGLAKQLCGLRSRSAFCASGSSGSSRFCSALLRHKFYALHVEQRVSLPGSTSLYSERTEQQQQQRPKAPRLSKPRKTEPTDAELLLLADGQNSDEDFWGLLAQLAQGLLRVLRLDGLLFALQVLLFSLLVQHYLPPLSRYYFDQQAVALLQGVDVTLERLLSEDLLLTATQPPGDAETSTGGLGGGAEGIALASLGTTPMPGEGLASRAASEDSAANSASQALQLLHPTYHTQEYTVQSGENISLIALRHRLKMSTLISVNHIEKARSLRAGQSLRIPNMDGLLYAVQQQDTLTGIAQKYDTSIGALIDANQLQREQLVSGTQIFIPGASLSRYELQEVFGDLFVYPVVGRLSSRFGYRRYPFGSRRREFHNGLDIVGPRSAPIKASSDGRVVAAGYHSIFGNYVILQHAKGIKTLYGHMSKILVQKDERVLQGELVGRIGTTGRSTGPHVHFTIFVAGRAVNPLDYLSSR